MIYLSRVIDFFNSTHPSNSFTFKLDLIMNGLLGNNASAKFVFLGCDDESLVPSKKEIKEFFPDSEPAIYKAWGHFKESFWEIESALNIKLNGSDAHSWGWHNNKSCISHAIRLNQNCERSSFFDLKYSDMTVAFLKLDHSSITSIGNTVKAIARANSLIDSVTDFADTFESVKTELNKMSLHDPKVDNPCKESLSNLLDDYGKDAKEQMLKKINQWFSNHLWT